MPVVVKIEITNPLLLENYAAILNAQGSGKDSKTTKVTELEQAIARTLFRGTTIKSTAGGVSPPDWFVTETGMVSLMKSIAGAEIINTQKFNDWVGQSIGAAEAVSIEGKLLQTSDQDGIKIGSLTVDPDNNSRMDSFSLASNGVIDVTRHNLINELRENWQGASEKFFKEGTNKDRKELNEKAINKAKLIAFNRNLGENISRDMQLFLNKDKTYNSLYRMLDQARLGKIDLSTSANKETVKMYVNTINNRYIREGFLHEMQILQKEGKLFDYILKTPGVSEQFYQKSRNLAIFRKSEKSINGVLLSFNRSDFTSKFFGAKFDVSSGAINVYLKSEVETMFLKQLPEEAATIRLGQNLKEFDEAVQKLAANNTKGAFDYLGEKINYLIPTGGSIPMSKAYLRFAAKTNLAEPMKFLNKDSSIPEQYTGNANKSMGTFISSEYLRLLVIKRMVDRMPQGPIGGPPLSNSMLTYRTGRFANSLNLVIDYRKRLIKYYYNPIYYVHEQTSRNPKVLIERSIREVITSRFKQQFAISEVGRI